MQNVRNSTEDHRGREEKLKGRKSGRKTNHERLWTPGNKLRASKGRGLGGWVSPVMGIKEGMYCMEHWVWCVNNELWNTTSITSDVLYGDKHNIKKDQYLIVHAFKN